VTPHERVPRVLFVCVKNGGKSPMAAALMRHQAGSTVLVDSAGTHPGHGINALSVRALEELGIDISDETPQAITPEMVTAADMVITLGHEAVVEPVPGTPVVNWDTDEPSLRGIEGIERMRIIRDDIATRVQALLDELINGEAKGTHNATHPNYGLRAKP
jgi:arsenate-mycothiol transferase